MSAVRTRSKGDTVQVMAMKFIFCEQTVLEMTNGMAENLIST